MLLLPVQWSWHSKLNRWTLLHTSSCTKNNLLFSKAWGMTRNIFLVLFHLGSYFLILLRISISNVFTINCDIIFCDRCFTSSNLNHWALLHTSRCTKNNIPFERWSEIFSKCLFIGSYFLNTIAYFFCPYPKYLLSLVTFIFSDKCFTSFKLDYWTLLHTSSCTKNNLLFSKAWGMTRNIFWMFFPRFLFS